MRKYAISDCPVCGKNKRSGDHQRCSKIMQGWAKEKPRRRKRTDSEINYLLSHLEKDPI